MFLGVVSIPEHAANHVRILGPADIELHCGGDVLVPNHPRDPDRSNTLKNRLSEHFTFTRQRRDQRGDTGRMYSRYEWAAINGIQASWAAVPTEQVKNLENDLLYWFGEMYGTVPFGNAQSAWAESRGESPV
ncbi:hypothetical protein [Nocardia otitidiscaviarum]|uniref:hypothetical protein n=1 Tax=Nocardia otitidiscaviarum TaxID=1823 RepID=UPI0024580A11|nr:hypothetical protein [Nocardia otitidiscaviarum]